MNPARKVIVVFSLFSFLVPFLAIGADPLTEDERWEVLNPEIEGVNGSVYSMIRYGDRLCIGGNFSAVCDVVAPGIACLDTTADVWYSPGDIQQGPVRAMAADLNGDLYVTASSAYLEEYPSYVARWDGTQLQMLAEEISGIVFALAVDSKGILYAAGDFSTIGGVSAKGLAAWDGAVWEPVGTELYGNVFNAVVVADDTLYVSGTGLLTGVPGQDNNNLARWDGTSWQIVGGGISGVINALTVRGNDLYVGGKFTTAGGVPASNVARWDGTQWHAVGAGPVGEIHALQAASDGTLYAAEFVSNDGPMQERMTISVFDGTQWQQQGALMDGFVGALALDPDDTLYIGGNFISVGDRLVASLLRGKEGDWKPIGAPGVLETVFAIATGDDGSLYVSDNKLMYANYRGPYEYYGRVKERTATGWVSLGGVSDMQILALEEYGGSLYAGGDFTKIGDTTASLLARWDGAAWQPLVDEMSGEYCVDLENSGGYLYAGGLGMNTAQGVYSPARWDGTAWHALDDMPEATLDFAFDEEGVPYIADGGDGIKRLGANGWELVGDYLGWIIMGVKIGSDGTIYAGGYDIDEYDIPSARVAEWDGSSWQLIAEGNYNSHVGALMTDDNGDLYAAGDFIEIGGVAANSIARWDGTSWHAMGSGLRGAVYELQMGADRRLYVGGEFLTAGGKFSPNIAAYKLDELPDEGTPDDDSIIGSDEEQSDSDTIISTPDGDDGNVTDTETSTDEDTKSSGTGCGCTVVME